MGNSAAVSFLKLKIQRNVYVSFLGESSVVRSNFQYFTSNISTLLHPPPPPPLQFLRLRIWNVRYHEWRNGVLYGRVYIKHGYNMEKQISRNKRIYFFSFFFRVEKILRANILIARELNVFNRMKGMIRTSLMSLISCYNMYSIHCIWIHTSASNSTNIITLDRCK